MTDSDAEVILGGGLLRAASPSAIDRIALGVSRVAPDARVLVAEHPPIVGAVLLGLDELGVTSAAADRARDELSSAYVRVERERSPISEMNTTAPIVRRAHG